MLLKCSSQFWNDTLDILVAFCRKDLFTQLLNSRLGI